MIFTNAANHTPRTDDEIYAIIRNEWDNRVEHWGEEYERYSESDFYRLFVDENKDSVSCCAYGDDKVDYAMLKNYMSYTCGVYAGYYEDTPESFAVYMGER